MRIEVLPIGSVIRNKRVISLLESQFPAGFELGVEPTARVNSSENYRLYARSNPNEDWDRDRFLVFRRRSSDGRIREYAIRGTLYIRQ